MAKSYWYLELKRSYKTTSYLRAFCREMEVSPPVAQPSPRGRTTRGVPPSPLRSLQAPSPSHSQQVTPRQGGAAQALIERMLETIHAELIAQPPDRETDRRRLHELLAAALASAGQDTRTGSLVEDASALLCAVCLKDDEYCGKLVSSVRRMQLDFKRVGRELQEELARIHAPPSPASSVVRAKESLQEQLMISDDLAEMLAGKESELECALAQVARLKTELEQAQLQASISARFSPSKSAPHYGRPSSVSGSPQAQRHSQDGRPSSFSGALDDSRASADTGRDEEVERVLEEMAANKRAAIRVKELEQQVALNVSHIERYEREQAALRQTLAETTRKEAGLRAVLEEMQADHEQMDRERTAARQLREQLTKAREDFSELSVLLKIKNGELEELQARVWSSQSKPKVDSSRRVHWDAGDHSPGAPPPPKQPQSWLAFQSAAAAAAAGPTLSCALPQTPTLSRALPQTPTQSGAAVSAEEDALQEINLMKLKKMAVGKAYASKMLRRWGRKHLYHSFLRWLDSIDHTNRIQRLMLKVCGRGTRASLLRLWCAWLDAVDQSARERSQAGPHAAAPRAAATPSTAAALESVEEGMKHELHKLDGRQHQRQMTQGRGQEASLQHQRLVQMKKYKQRWRHLRIRTPLISWAVACHASRRRQHVGGALRRRWGKLLLSTAFDEWFHEVHHAIRSRCAERLGRGRADFPETLVSYFHSLLSSSRRHRLLREAIGAWEGSARDTKLLARMQSTCMVRRHMVVMGNTWSDWKCTVKQFRWLRGFLSKMQRKLAASTWFAWQESVRHTKLLARMQSTCMVRRHMVVMGNTWSDWKCTVKQFRWLRGFLSKKRTYLSKVRQSWAAWRMSAAQTAWTTIELESCSLHLSKRYMVRMLRQCFEALRLATATHKSAMAFTLDRWLRWTRQPVETGRCHKGRMCQVWEEWRAVVKGESRLNQAASRVMRRWMKLGVSRTLLLWHVGAVEQKCRLRLMQKVTLRWCNKLLSLCFAHWRRQTHDELRQKSLVFRATKKLNHISLSRAFDTWKNTSGKIMTCNHACYQMVSRRVCREQARRLRKWLVCTVENVRFKAAAMRIISRCAAAVLRRYYNHWSHLYMELRRLRQACMLVVLRWRNAVQLAGWSWWRQQYLDQKRLRLACSKILHRWGKLHTFAAWSRWREQCLDQKRLRQACSKLLLRWGKLQMFVPFRTWEEHAERQRRLMRAAKTVVLRWKKQGLSRAWNAWSLRTSSRKQTCAVCRKIVLRWSRMGTARAFFSWQCVYETKCHWKRIAATIAAVHSRQLLASAVGIWHPETINARRLRVGSLRVLNKHDRVLVGCATAAWRLRLQRSQSLRRVHVGIVAKRCCLGLREYWAVWRQHVRTNRVHTTVSERITIKWARRTLITAWNSWCSWLHQAWAARVSRSQNEMAHALGGSEIGIMLHESARKDYQVLQYS